MFLRGADIARAYHPDTDSLTAACVHIARILEGLFVISSMQAADMFVVQATPSPYEHFIELETV